MALEEADISYGIEILYNSKRSYSYLGDIIPEIHKNTKKQKKEMSIFI